MHKYEPLDADHLENFLNKYEGKVDDLNKECLKEESR